MKQLLRKKAIKGHRGFTLIELVVCIAVVAILAAIAVPNIVTAQKQARLAKYDEHAKTVFLAAQTRLTSMRYSGELESVNTDPRNKALTADMLPAVPENDGVDVRTLRLNMDKTIGTDAQILKNVLDDQIYDTSVLDASISVEYSATTGRIYAVCYSEDAKGFCYNTESDDGRLTNISDRSEDVRSERMFGYYGVDQLFNAEVQNDVQIAEVKLINDEYLYLKWQTVTNAGLLATDVDANFTVRLYSGAQTTPSYTINVHSADVRLLTASQSLSYYDIASGTEKNCVYRDGDDYILVLDATDINSTAEHSITKRYESIPLNDTMRAGVTVTPVGSSIESDEMLSNYEHPLYTTFDKDGIALTLDNGQYGVGKARHFYNLRYGSASGSYIQTQDIDYGKAYDDGFVTDGGQNVLHAPNDHLFPMQEFGAGNYVFKGLYDGGGYTLKNMNVMGVSGKPAGIFSALEGKNNGWGSGTGKDGVKNLTLSGISVGVATGVTPGNDVGALAGVCTADIADVTVKDSKVTGVNNVGGVVGSFGTGNGKSVINSAITAENVVVTGMDQVGGVVGLISYAGNDLKINAAFKNLVTPEGEGSVSGNSYVGGVVGRLEHTKKNSSGVTLKGFENQAKVSGSTYVGGITGYSQKETLDTCINKGFVYSLAPTAEYIGGITGYNGGTVKDCKCIDSVIPQGMDVKTLMGTNVGGIAGYNYEGVKKNNNSYSTAYGVIKNCEFSGTVAGKQNVGGIVGNNASTETNSLVTCETTGGTVYGMGTGSKSIGGIVGLNAGVLISGHDNAANVLGSTNAGGIVGDNGTGCTIRDCTNSGAVVASVQYGGGIAGRNLGTIENCSTNTPDPSAELKAELVGWAQGSDIGGIAGYNEGTIKITGSVKTNCRAVVAGVDNIGGIVGFNTGTISGYRLTGGQVLATGDCAGGFFGLNTSRASLSSAGGAGTQDQTQAVFETNELYASPSLVEGVRFVGGVIGCNLVAADAQGTVAFACSNGANANDAGTVKARSFAGGMMGYNGIVESVTPSAITTALNKLKTDTATVYRYAYPAESTATVNKLTYIAYSKNYMGVEAKEYIGGVIGLNSSASKLTVTNCINYGKLKTTEKNTGVLDYYIGGITGRNSVSGKIEYCENLGSVTSYSRYVGGLVEVNEGEISNCKLSGTISADKASSTGTGATGGAAGLNGSLTSATINSNAKIIYCTTTDTAGVSSTGSSVGGIAGDNYALISNCSASGGVSGTNNVGGVIGYNALGASVSNITTGSHSSNAVVCTSSSGCVGGVIGYNAGNSSNLINRLNVRGAGWYTGGVVGNHAGTSITNCSNYGTVYSSSAAYNNNSYVSGKAANSAYAGGITAYNAAGVTVSGCSNYGNVTGCANFTGGITGLNRGTIENCEALGGTINGAGTGSGSKYVGGIAGENAVTGIITNTDTGYVELKSNINATGLNGTFDVGGLLGINKNKDCIISNYNYAGEINASSRSVNAGGIIGRNETGSIVDNCTLTGTVKAINTGSNIGGIVGVNRGTVQNITLERTVVAAKVEGGNSTVTGGIVGSNNKDCLVTNIRIGTDSINDPNKLPLEVNGGHAGGIVGKNTGNIEDSISYAKVQGSQNAGGIFGTTPSNKADVSSFTLKDLKNYGAVTGNSITGGIAGTITCGNVTTDIRLEDCANYGTVNGASTGGIIGKSDSGASSHIVLNDCMNKAEGNVTGKSHAGGAIGWSIGNAELQRCNNLGTVSGSNSAAVGGIIGLAEGTNGGKTLKDCENSGAVSGIKEVGGIVGVTKSRISIENCTARAGSSVTGTGNAGGIVGRLTGVSGSSIDGCTVEAGAVITGGSSSNKSAGGIAGYTSNVTVKNCTNNAALTSSYRAGGIVGFGSSGTVIETCMNFAAIYAKERAGGIVGVCENTVGRIANCENSGTITSNAYAGGIAGERTKLSGTSTLNVTDCVNSAAVSTLGSEGASGGMFGNVDGRSALSIVSCTNSGAVTALVKNAGGIVGSIASDGTPSTPVHRIENCKNTGEISSSTASAAVQRIGGIVGSSYSTLVSATDNSGIINVSSTGNVTRIGGITGVSGNMGSIVADCTNSGAINVSGASAQYIGGICGELCATAVSNKNTGAVNAQNANCVGGIAGGMTHINGHPIIINSSVSNVTESHGDITVTGINLHSVGGIVGSCIKGSVISAYAECDISVDDAAQSKVGGIAGFMGSNGTEELKNCYFAGRILPMSVAAVDSYRGGIVGELQNRALSTVTITDAGYVVSGVPQTQITTDLASKQRAVGNLGDWNTFGIITVADASTAYTRVGSYHEYQLQPQANLRVAQAPNSAAYTISWDYPAGHVGGYTVYAYLAGTDESLGTVFHTDDPNELTCTYTPDEANVGRKFYLKIVNCGIMGLSTDSELTRSSDDYTIYATLPKPGAPTWVYKSYSGTNATYIITYTKAQFDAVYNTTDLRNAVDKLVLTYDGTETAMTKQSNGNYTANMTFDFEDEGLYTKSFPLTLKAVAKEPIETYIYYSSGLTSFTLNAFRPEKLSAPTLNLLTYTGTMSEPNMYDVTINKVSGASKYVIKLFEGDGDTPVKTDTVDSSDASTYTVHYTSSDLNDETALYKVSAQALYTGTDGRYLDSDEDQITSFRLPTKLTPVEKITVTLSKRSDPSYPSYVVSWSDAGTADKFEVHIDMEDTATSFTVRDVYLQNSSSASPEKTNTTLNVNSYFGHTMKIEVKKLGATGTTVDSDYKALEFVIPERLAGITEATSYRDSEDQSVVHVMWSLPDTVTEENCSAVQVYTVDNTNVQTPVKLVSITDAPQMTVTFTDVGSAFVTVMPIGIDGVAFDGAASAPFAIQTTQTKLDKPKSVSAVTSTDAGVVSAVVSFEPAENALMQAFTGGYTIELYDLGNAIIATETLTADKRTYTFTNVPGAHTVRIKANAQNGGVFFDSDWTVADVTAAGGTP